MAPSSVAVALWATRLGLIEVDLALRTAKRLQKTADKERAHSYIKARDKRPEFDS